MNDRAASKISIGDTFKYLTVNDFFVQQQVAKNLLLSTNKFSILNSFIPNIRMTKYLLQPL